MVIELNNEQQIKLMVMLERNKAEYERGLITLKQVSENENDFKVSAKIWNDEIQLINSILKLLSP